MKHFNISVAIPGLFMECVRYVPEFKWVLRFGDTPLKKDGSWWELDGMDLWRKIVTNAWSNGEPGIIFIDRINELNPLKAFETISATNPCGEQPLAPYSSCNLGSINLSNFVKSDFTIHPTKPDYIDWTGLKSTIQTAVRFLDNVIGIPRLARLPG